MPDYTAKRIDDMQALHGGAMKKARAELGVTSFGFQVIDLPPNFADYPEHDHGNSRQEEVYGALAGSGELDVEGERIDISPEVFVRVGANARRKIYAGPDGLRLIALGAVPGEAYAIEPATELE
jgi:quercetin dioxygenase-like cupin family protein